MKLQPVSDNPNPLSARGWLSFPTFVLTVLVAIVVNTLVFISIRGQILAARAAADKQQVVILYGAWIVLSVFGFAVISNAFIKRWNSILQRTEPNRFWNGLLRFSLLSPLLSYPMTLVTLLYFPKSPFEDVRRGGSSESILATSFATIVLSVVISVFLPSSWLGIDRLKFRDSVQSFSRVGFGSPKNPFPSETVLKPAYAVLTPGGRYLGWLLSDFMRARALSVAVAADPATMCQERLGLFGQEVPDCYFWNWRKVGEVTPFVSPYFALFFEAQYRRPVVQAMASDPNRTAIQGLAADMVMVSNLIELLEPSELFIERIRFLQPSFLLHAYASPEVPLVEAGQDVQRLSLLKRTLPELERQLSEIRVMLDEVGPTLGVDEISVRSEYSQLDRRLAALKRGQ